MAKKYHLQQQPIPDGFRIFEERLEVKGVVNYRAFASSFCKGRDPSLSLKCEPTNSHDPNAIQVHGHWKGWINRHRETIGYVPREVAARLAQSGLADLVAARLLKTYAGDDGFAEVLFQIVGPADRYAEYAALCGSSSVRVKAKVELGNVEDAILDLLATIESGEKRSKRDGLGVAPRPYLDLAKIYRKRKQRDEEIAILQRYDQQIKAPGKVGEQLTARLSKLQGR
jgi:hypothetical protein